MYELKKIESLVDMTTRIIVRDRLTNNTLSCSEYYDFVTSWIYKKNKNKKVKICKTNMENTFIVFL